MHVYTVFISFYIAWESPYNMNHNLTLHGSIKLSRRSDWWLWMPGGEGGNKGDLFLVVLLVLLCELWIYVILNFPGEGVRKWKKEFSFHGNSLCSNPQAMYKLAMLQVCFTQSLSVAFIQRTRSIIIYAPHEAILRRSN